MSDQRSYKIGDRILYKNPKCKHLALGRVTLAPHKGEHDTAVGVTSDDGSTPQWISTRDILGLSNILDEIATITATSHLQPVFVKFRYSVGGIHVRTSVFVRDEFEHYKHSGTLVFTQAQWRTLMLVFEKMSCGLVRFEFEQAEETQ